MHSTTFHWLNLQGLKHKGIFSSVGKHIFSKLLIRTLKGTIWMQFCDMYQKLKCTYTLTLQSIATNYSTGTLTQPQWVQPRIFTAALLIHTKTPEIYPSKETVIVNVMHIWKNAQDILVKRKMQNT